MPDRLEDLHRKIADLTDPDGDFAVVCPLNGKRPVPVKGRSFPSADAAEDAVELVCEYRAVLREVDPHLENLPLAAVEEAAEPLRLTFDSERASRKRFRDRSRDERASDRSSTRGECSDEREQSRDRRTPRERIYSHGNGRQPSHSITLSGDGEQEWLRIDDAPVVTVREDGEPLGDAAVERQLNAKL